LLASEEGRLLFRAPEAALDTDLREQVRFHKEGLMSALSSRPGFVQLSPPSYNQVSLYFLHLADRLAPAYNLALVMRIRSTVDVGCMRVALDRLARRHDQLRTTLDHLQLGETAVLCQFVAQDLIPRLEEFDMRGSTDGELRERAQDFYAEPFNLEVGPIVRAGLFQRAADDQVLVVKLHHVAADGWSLGIIARDLGRCYRSACEGTDAEPQAIPRVAYTDFALEQIDLLAQPNGGSQMEFWQQALTPIPEGLELRTKSRRPAVRRSVGATQYFEIDAEEKSRIEACAQALNITPFALLLACFQALLLRRSRQGDVCVGIPTLGRRGEDFNDTVGYFVNPVALRSRRPGQVTFREHAKRTAEEMTAALDHRDVPFAALVENLQVKRDTSRTPVFQVLFNLLSRRMLGDVVDLIYPSPKEVAVDFGGLAATSFALNQQEGQFDVTLEFVDRQDGLFGLFKYCTDLFSADEARSMVNELRQLLVNVVSDPDAVIVEGPVVGMTSQSESDERKPALVVTATFTAESMQTAFEYWFERLDWQGGVSFAPFNQVFQTLLDPTSSLRRNPDRPGVALVRFDDLLGTFQGAGEQASSSVGPECIERLRTNLDGLAQAVEQAAHAAAAPLLVVVCPSSPALQSSPQEASLRGAFVGQLQSIQGVQVLTPEVLAGWYPVQDFYEPLGEKLGNIPYKPAFLVALASGIVRTLHGTTGRPCKAIAVDCDNTLWDGVVGEDGASGVTVGPHQRAFQEYLLEQHRAGVVLCLCSKNREADVWSVFDHHPDMPLRREHIGFWKINWDSKSSNLRDLAAEINIGMDAFAFFDDNPVERAEMRANCPSVLCAELPEDWSLRVPYLRHLWPLDHLRVTDADRKRNEHYRTERLRKDLQGNANSLGDFLSKLQMEIETHPALPSELERLAQLSIRTNQFNTTARRMTLAEIERYASSSGQLACATHVRDRFGDYGLVGAALASIQDGSCLRIDSLLLSCRAMGRGVEHRMATWLGAQAKAHACSQVAFPLTRTDRNEPARKFLGKLGQLCEGEFDAQRTLLVSSSRLADVTWKLDEGAGGLGGAKANADTPEGKEQNAHALGDDRALSVAADLGTVDAIVAAVDEYHRHKRRRHRTEAVGSSLGGAPTSSTERTISDAWKRVLALEDVGTRENFFEIGGSSVLLAQLAVDLGRHGVDVSIIDLLQYPTVAALAGHLSQLETATPDTQPDVGTGSRVGTKGAKQLKTPFDRLRQYRRR
jgi:FkbH-like protein